MEILEILISILLIGTLFIAMLYVYAKVIRLFKKKSHQHIVRPLPDKDRHLYPTKMAEYYTYIFIKDADEDYLFGKINQFLGMEEASEDELVVEMDEKPDLYSDDELDEDQELEFEEVNWYKYLQKEYNLTIDDIVIRKFDSWFILKLKNPSFLDYHTLIWWLHDVSDIYKNPSDIIGFCNHKTKPLKDYIVKIDDDSEDDIIGSFRTHQNFGIYLPHADLMETGNMSLTRNHEINFYTEISKLPFEELKKEMMPYDKLLNHFKQKSVNVPKIEDNIDTHK